MRFLYDRYRSPAILTTLLAAKFSHDNDAVNCGIFLIATTATTFGEWFPYDRNGDCWTFYNDPSDDSDSSDPMEAGECGGGNAIENWRKFQKWLCCLRSEFTFFALEARELCLLSLRRKYKQNKASEEFNRTSSLKRLLGDYKNRS